MGNRLLGKRCIITGASRGIGRAIAIGFAQEGAQIIVNFPNKSDEKATKETILEIRRYKQIVYGVKADVSQVEDVNKLVHESVDYFGGIDVLVNNAGICPWSSFLDMPLSIWEKTQAINHRGTFLCSQAVARQLLKQKTGGSIITIGSVGAYTGGPQQAHYNASKAAVGALMRSIAVALGPYGIRANTILPGCIETDINRIVLENPEERKCLNDRIPLQRIGIPEDIVGAAIYFASDESKYCTGSELCIDGGISINV